MKGWSVWLLALVLIAIPSASWLYFGTGGHASARLVVIVMNVLILLAPFLPAFIVLTHLLNHRRLNAATRELDSRSLVRGPFGVVTHVRGLIDRVPVVIHPRRIELDVASPRKLVLGQRELRAIARGDTTDVLGALAAQKDVQLAATRLLELRVAGVDVTPVRTTVKRLALRDALSGARAVLALVRAGALVRSASPSTVCPYCKSDVAPRESEGVIRCPSCDSLHHTPCWQEHGGCSVHGCARVPGDRRERATN